MGEILMGYCSVCRQTEYNLARGSGNVTCITCGTVANSDVRVWQITYLNDQKITP
jgi:hypothetical protein